MAVSKKGTKQKRLPNAKERDAKVHDRRNGTASTTEDADKDRRRFADRARIAATQRADLLAVAAHDLRNPLGVVLVTTTMLTRELTGQHQLEQLGAIRRAAIEMTHVIDDLVDSASIDADDLDLAKDDCAPTDVLVDAVAAARASASERLVTVETRIEHDLPLLYADRHRLLQVFSRVVTNALRFMPKSGTITIEAVREIDAIRFSVADTGPLVPESQRPFAFLRRPPPGRRACRGAGLGMFVVKGIVEAHGGSVELTSDPERGNKVSFTLPTKRAEDEAEV